MTKHSNCSSKNVKENARKLRKNMTEEERILWSCLRRYHQHHRFRRQYIIGNYIADFVCLEKMLVIEIDGSQHFEYEQERYDMVRTLEIEELGFRVIRFTNTEIRRELSRVLRGIYYYLTGEL